VGVVGVTFTLFTPTEPLVTPPHKETKVNPYVPQPRGRVKGGFPILLDAPVAAPVHVRLNVAPAVADAHEKVTLLFKLSVAVNSVGGEGATEADATELYVVKPLSVAPTWKEYVPGERVTVNGFVVGSSIVPPVLIVNVQLGVDTPQERVIEEVAAVAVSVGTAGRITVIGKSGEDAGPRIPRRRHATVKLSVVDVPGANTVPLG